MSAADQTRYQNPVNFPSTHVNTSRIHSRDTDQRSDSSRLQNGAIANEVGSKAHTRSTGNGQICDDNGPFLPVYLQHGDCDESCFEIVSVIAKGAFGDVMKVIHRKDGTVYAMKVMLKKKIIKEGAVQQAKDEATIQDAVGYHPMIVKPFWFFQNSLSIFIVMEYVAAGDLFEIWRRTTNFPESLIRIYIAELSTVLEFLHDSGVIYRDLKMENILLDGRGHLHLTDFGLAKRLRRGQRTNTICGTLQYVAPEIVNIEPYGHATDWWSLGILMYILLVGQFPVSGAKDHVEMAEFIRCTRYELPNTSTAGVLYSRESRHCLRHLLELSPRKRISSLDTLRRLPFFQDVNFDTLLQGPIDFKAPMYSTSQSGPNKRLPSSENQISPHTQSPHPDRETFAWDDTIASLKSFIV